MVIIIDRIMVGITSKIMQEIGKLLKKMVLVNLKVAKTLGLPIMFVEG